MKKYFIVFLLLIASIGSMAQKSYVHVHHSGSDLDLPSSYIVLSGDVPTNMKSQYSREATIGMVLNNLSNNGFEVEYVTSRQNSTIYLLSKKSSDVNNAIQRMQSDNEDVVEVARYNLQGLPVKESEKGIQIIVYSNYTTKTVLVQ
jgi:hypothetical protein